jgi:hypothetical protein
VQGGAHCGGQLMRARQPGSCGWGDAFSRGTPLAPGGHLQPGSHPAGWQDPPLPPPPPPGAPLPALPRECHLPARTFWACASQSAKRAGGAPPPPVGWLAAVVAKQPQQSSHFTWPRRHQGRGEGVSLLINRGRALVVWWAARHKTAAGPATPRLTHLPHQHCPAAACQLLRAPGPVGLVGYVGEGLPGLAAGGQAGGGSRGS